jgi:hypothetical protein
MARYQWIKVVDPAPFAGRDGAGLLAYDGAMWLIGGWSKRSKVHFPRICSNDVWRSVDGLQWGMVKPNSFIDETFNAAADWEGRHTAGYAVFEGRMWILGGDCNQRHYQPDVWNSRDGRQWTRICHGDALPWGRRVLHHSLVFKDWLWVMGGQAMTAFVPGPDAFHNDIWRSRDGRNWEQVKPLSPHWSPRGMIGHFAVFRDRMWIIGGGTYDTPNHPTRLFFNDVWSSGDGVTWTCHLQQAPWAPRQYHEVAAWDDRLWVLEGWDGRSNRKDVWHSTDGEHWEELPDTPWKPRHAASVCVFDDALWVIAGNNMEPDVWKLVRTTGPCAAR